MAGTMPAYLRDEIANHIAALDTYVPPANVYAALCTSAPVAATPGTEILAAANEGYARVELALEDLFSMASGVLTTLIEILFPQNTDTGAWESCTWVEFYDAASDGNRCLPWLVLSGAVACPINEQVRIAAGQATETAS